MTTELQNAAFPEGLLEWAGNRSGGVRRLFNDGSGRPAGELIETRLLDRMRQWAAGVAGGSPDVPRIVLLVGGPGNGKTEAVEETIRTLERELAIDGELQAIFAQQFAPVDGSTVPRLVRVQLHEELGVARGLVLTVVQDASVGDPQYSGRSAAMLLVEDLEAAIKGSPDVLYLACVNRGVLDDALIYATENQMVMAAGLLGAVTSAVAVGPRSPACWPLSGRTEVGVWPMDVESLLQSREGASGLPNASSPASQVLALATDEDRWIVTGACPAGPSCPFCRNRELLSGAPNGPAFLQILRWYELASGKRWSFRDLLSLTSFVLAGAPPSEDAIASTPCEWAAHLAQLNAGGNGRPDSLRLAAPFLLMASQYQHVLFGNWPHFGRSGIRRQLRELQIDGNPTLLGLHHFLTMDRAAAIPATLRSQLASFCETLDPALADPDLEIPISGRTTVRLREIDSRFSIGVREGVNFIRRYKSLSYLEADVLSRLAAADETLADPSVRGRKPTVAAELQVLVRDIACRVVRRSLGARAAIVRDVGALREFEQVVNGDHELRYQAARHVAGLLNQRERFVVTLNTTFGEPQPPEARRVVLETPKQKVRPPRDSEVHGRPAADVCFLSVGSNTATQWIPLTYELFKSVRELGDGMLAASLPRNVTAALDAARGKLAGRIVRDEEQLDGAEIRIGFREETIVREMGRFLVRSGNAT